MNGQHLIDLRAASLDRDEEIDERNAHTGGRCTCGHSQVACSVHPLDDAWAVDLVLAAYDHILFLDGAEIGSRAWSAALQDLLGARSRILAGIIPVRLRAYRPDGLAWGLGAQP